MRDILFRGKREDNGEWIEGIPFPDDNWGITICRYNQMDGNIEENDVDPSSVGRSTALVDANGTTIFEGDIIGVKHPEQKEIFPCVPCIVKYGEYEDEYGVPDCRYLGFYLEVNKLCCSILNPLSYGMEYVVIGNIHDNPELLERGAENE